MSAGRHSNKRGLMHVLNGGRSVYPKFLWRWPGSAIFGVYKLDAFEAAPAEFRTNVGCRNLAQRDWHL